MLMHATHKLLTVMICLCVLPAQAWILNLLPAGRRVYLQVGDGNLNANNGTVNRVSVTVPAQQVGNNVPQLMTSNSTQSTSSLDGASVCPLPTQVYLGASYQRSNAPNSPVAAILTATAQANLTNAAGNTIPITEISWTTSNQRAGATTTIPAGALTGATQTISVAANTYLEDCLTFSYANTAGRAPGTYDARVTFTMAIP